MTYDIEITEDQIERIGGKTIEELAAQSAALLDALETLHAVSETPYPIDKRWLGHFTTEAIRKAK